MEEAQATRWRNRTQLDGETAGDWMEKPQAIGWKNRRKLGID
jgi:hypothetical protein